MWLDELKRCYEKRSGSWVHRRNTGKRLTGKLKLVRHLSWRRISNERKEKLGV
jgi:hypothetical protein